MPTLEEQNIPELLSRVRLGSALIKLLHMDSDPRAPRAIRVLQEQQRELNEVLVERIRQRRKERGIPEPPAVVVGLKAAPLVARQPNMGG